MFNEAVEVMGAASRTYNPTEQSDMAATGANTGPATFARQVLDHRVMVITPSVPAFDGMSALLRSAEANASGQTVSSVISKHFHNATLLLPPKYSVGGKFWSLVDGWNE